MGEEVADVRGAVMTTSRNRSCRMSAWRVAADAPARPSRRRDVLRCEAQEVGEAGDEHHRRHARRTTARTIELPFGEIRADPANPPGRRDAAAAAPGTPSSYFGIRPFDVRVTQSGAGYRRRGQAGRAARRPHHRRHPCRRRRPQTCIAEAQAAGVRHGDRLNFSIDAARAHLFDPATERRSHDDGAPNNKSKTSET